MPTPITEETRTPVAASFWRTRSAAASRLPTGSSSTASACSCSQRMRWARSATATRTWLWPKVDADRRPGRGVEREQHRRPAALGPAGPGGVRCLGSAMKPPARSSPIRVETVVRDSPVSRERSAWLTPPLWRRTSTTRLRLRSRSEARPPDARTPNSRGKSTAHAAVCQVFAQYPLALTPYFCRSPDKSAPQPARVRSPTETWSRT